MIELIKKMVTYLPIEEIKDNDILLMKGIYKLPSSVSNIKTQIKYNRQWQ